MVNPSSSRPVDAVAPAAGSSRFVLLENAVRAGHATSNALARQMGSSDPWRLAESIGVSIELRDRCPDNPHLRSEVVHSDQVIVLYTEALADLSRVLVLRAPRLACAPLDTIAVATEVYRFVERSRPELLKGAAPGWPRVAREIAAHAFAQDLLELPFFPAEIDAVERLSRAVAYPRLPHS